MLHLSVQNTILHVNWRQVYTCSISQDAIYC